MGMKLISAPYDRTNSLKGSLLYLQVVTVNFRDVQKHVSVGETTDRTIGADTYKGRFCWSALSKRPITLSYAFIDSSNYFLQALSAHSTTHPDRFLCTAHASFAQSLQQRYWLSDGIAVNFICSESFCVYNDNGIIF